MDKEQEELQFIGFFGIWREAFKIISTWSEIFIRLGLALTLPLSFIYLAHTEINHLLIRNMYLTINTFALTGGDDPSSYDTTTRALSRELAVYILIQVTYIVFLLVFALLSTSAVVYTVACIYSGKSVTFKEVIRVVPKVWKRLMVTFLCVMAIMFLYNFVFTSIVVLINLAYPITVVNMGKYIVFVFAIAVLYIVGLSYMSVIWQLANTVSVLEESYGFQALRKSKILMKGKMGISVAIFLVSNFCVGGTLLMYKSFVVNQSNGGMLNRAGFGIISFFLLCILNLLGLVVNTVFYLVCKSYHHEQIDKIALADHLDVYHGEGYILLKPKDIQLMEQV